MMTMERTNGNQYSHVRDLNRHPILFSGKPTLAQVKAEVFRLTKSYEKHWTLDGYEVRVADPSLLCSAFVLCEIRVTSTVDGSHHRIRLTNAGSYVHEW